MQAPPKTSIVRTAYLSELHAGRVPICVRGSTVYRGAIPRSDFNRLRSRFFFKFGEFSHQFRARAEVELWSAGRKQKVGRPQPPAAQPATPPTTRGAPAALFHDPRSSMGTIVGRSSAPLPPYMLMGCKGMAPGAQTLRHSHRSSEQLRVGAQQKAVR